MEQFHDIDKVCRACLSDDRENASIFGGENEINSKGVQLWRILELHGGIEVFRTDGLPQRICSKCILKLNVAHSLWEHCQEADKKLRKLLRKSPGERDPAFHQNLSNNDFSNPLKILETDDSITIKNEGPHLEKIPPQPSENLQPLSPSPTSETPDTVQKNSATPLDHSKPSSPGAKPPDPYQPSFPSQISEKTFQGRLNLIKHLNPHEKLPLIEVDCLQNQSQLSKPLNSFQKPSEPLEIILKSHQPLEINSSPPKALEIPSERKFTCASCSQSFKTKKSLINHNTKLHSKSPEGLEDQEHKCETCSKTFRTELKLQRHQKTHEALKNPDFRRFLCHICSKTFRQKTGLTFHMRTHTGDKPYVCKFCNRGFASKSNCINHERTHTGVRPFVCHFCSAAFAKSCTLKAHITTHTGEANYHCKTCGKSFKRLKYLKEHRFTHTGEKPYICKMCGTGYSHSGSLFVHEKKCKAQGRSFGEGGGGLEGLGEGGIMKW
ncbi:zinc finger protein 260 [Diachasma alloeum]|uniref:zinc finger protein 260 n=1 Tax=Diachasma alloeum TaxID=454923 RepID=UPI0007382FE4|nr:zinc finger protein 260 [Diachasma alloeum]